MEKTKRRTITIPKLLDKQIEKDRHDVSFSKFCVRLLEKGYEINKETDLK
jgi:hypothetical protein